MVHCFSSKIKSHSVAFVKNKSTAWNSLTMEFLIFKIKPKYIWSTYTMGMKAMAYEKNAVTPSQFNTNVV